MDSVFFWNLFLETGAPEAYLLYQHEAKNERKLAE